MGNVQIYRSNAVGNGSSLHRPAQLLVQHKIFSFSLSPLTNQSLWITSTASLLSLLLSQGLLDSLQRLYTFTKPTIYTRFTILMILRIFLTEFLRLLWSRLMTSKLQRIWTLRTRLLLWAVNGRQCLKMRSPTLSCPCLHLAKFWTPPTKAAEAVESDKMREV